MKNRFMWFTLVFSISTLILLVSGADLTAEPVKSKRHPKVSIPGHAVEVVPGKLFWLGTAMDKGRLVEGYAIVHPKRQFGKPSGCNNDGKCQGWEDPTCGDCTGGGVDPGKSSCYGFLAKGAKWKTIEDYLIDTDNSVGLGSEVIRNILAAGIDKWEDAADGMMFDGYILDIIGDEIPGVVDGADLYRTDGKNEVLFADLDDPGAIAVTIVWGIFRGNPANRELVEWDQVYDDWDFNWSQDCEFDDCSNKMDFDNIATHELGHSFGLDDLYEDTCFEETMYGYASTGETNKRTLENGDITGIYTLYNF